MLFLSTINSQLSTAHAQGSLTPPGAPAPTMKTLDQIEPRTPLSQPGSFPILITQPGSYYLTGNITGTSSTDGIRINVSGGTIDLNGFELAGTGSGTFSNGIAAPSAISNVTIRNGVVRGWGHRGLDLELVTNARIEKVTASGCSDYGARTGNSGVVNESTFTGNSRGLEVSSGSVVTHSIANGNTNYGFIMGAGSIPASAAYQNGQAGIYALSGCVVSECSAYLNGTDGISLGFGNTAAHCGVYSNGNDGIVASLACVIKDNSVYGNTGDNIEVATDCLVINNTCTSAGFNAGDGAGIHVTNSRNRIEGNNVTLCDRGLDVVQPNNIILNNSVTRNPTTGTPQNYVIVAGNQVNILLTYLPETIAIPATVTLSGDLTGVSGSNGLTISADNVSVDLAGHALVGVAGSLKGIAVSGVRANLTIKNGTVRNWGGDGVDAVGSVNGQFDRLQLSNNGGNGISIGDRALATDCTARQNSGHGIFGGIINTVSRCLAALNTGVGISVSETALIEKCNLSNNTGGGIAVSNFSIIRDNLCDFHTAAAGIHVTGTDNRIEGNNVTRNARGIDIGAAGNLIIKNSASGSTGTGAPSANYDFNAFIQTNGAIITATRTISADPWANFSY